MSIVKTVDELRKGDLQEGEYLKTCPFCDGKAEIRFMLDYIGSGRFKDRWSVGCYYHKSACIASSDYAISRSADRNKAIERWNTRF